MTYKTLVFVSYELAPVNPGGCGVFLWHSLHELLKKNDLKIILLLDMPKHECEQFKVHYQPQLPNCENLRLICLSELLEDDHDPLELQDLKNIYLWKSYLFYKGLLKITAKERVNYVEFFDYVGIGYYSIKAKKFEKQFQGVTFSIRAHCTVDLMDLEQNQKDFNKEKIEMFQMEKDAINNVDYLLVPSTKWGEIYHTRYGISKERIVLSPPVVNKWEGISYEISAEKSDVLFYGRIFQLKGVDVYIDAAVTFLSRYPHYTSNFYLVGYDSQSSEGILYKELLLRRVPTELKERFIFTGQLDHQSLAKILTNVRFAVFPNFVESFCYSIHELYNLNIPIICNGIPAFIDYFKDGVNALVYDGSTSDLVNKMTCLFENEDILYRISNSRPVLDKNLFRESYNNIIYANEMSETLSASVSTDNLENPISLIILAEEKFSPQKIEYYQGLPNINLEKSYVLCNEEPGIPVNFLGKLRFARLLDGTIPNDISLQLASYFLVGILGDQFDVDYIRNSLNVFSYQPNLNFVGAYIITDQKKKCVPYDLYRNDPYLLYQEPSRCIFRNVNKTSLRDLFDSRLGEYGELQYLKGNGHIMPRYLIKTMPHPITNNKSRIVFFKHRETVGLEWNPFILYPLILENITHQNNSIKFQTFSLKRKIYHKLITKAKGMSGFRGKLAVKFLDIAYRFAKKIKVNW
jgi:glycosyltransferase involved in cell wall biosynthesis